MLSELKRADKENKSIMDTEKNCKNDAKYTPQGDDYIPNIHKQYSCHTNYDCSASNNAKCDLL